MQISIWSDIRCPFCYIGKRKFEAALAKFPYKDEITVAWKSFELDPNMQTRTDISSIEQFMESKGVDRDSAEGMFENVTTMAAEVGLKFQIDKIVPANSLNAHRLLHFAKKQGVVDTFKEALLQAHLEQGKNIDDTNFLIEIATINGLDGNAVKEMLASDDYTYDVRQDEMEARNLGVNGVPFFVLDKKYGISGAQPVEVFSEALEKAWEKHNKEKLTVLKTSNAGGSCDVNGNCD
ncbi:DsbA family oxidoreductase [Cellulophaga sp. HaHaR_3_176]|uniref:DsbA family oxidoreductase n=1 Tax=Cellulophaga sp. HaHaR_3_176 TaxID=1942464 RepID=UPI001C1F2C10|nr:DsbA family oxidoreductase [Cellulophaga sp. HaHaR_3_176]QWX83782.1 DsbA family oxidoreductase [Cellulophaga sp. HaHaR_3_176]